MRGFLAHVAWLSGTLLLPLRAQAPGAIFKEARTDTCSFGSSRAPVSAIDGEGAVWCLFHRERDGAGSTFLRRADGLREVSIVAVTPGGLVAAPDGAVLHVFWETADKGIVHRLFAPASAELVGEATNLPFAPGSRLLDVGVAGNGLVAALARTGEPAEVGSELQLALRAPDQTEFGKPLTVAKGPFGRARLAVDRAVHALFEDARAELRVRALDLATSAFDDPVGKPVFAGGPVQAAPEAEFEFAVRGGRQFVAYVPRGTAQETWLASAPTEARAEWQRGALPKGSLRGLAPFEHGLVAVVLGPGQIAKEGLGFFVCGPAGERFAAGELLPLQKEMLVDVRVGRAAKGRPAVAIVTRPPDGRLRAQATTLARVPLVDVPRGYAARAQGRDQLGRRDKPWATAIGQALGWLEAHQDEDGKWDVDAFMKHDLAGEPCDGPGNPMFDIGVTGLAALCFLADGGTLHGERHREPLERAVRWLIDLQQENGAIGGPHDRMIYEHSIATMVLCEASAVSCITWSREPARKALGYLEAHRNPYSVWRYLPRDNDNSTSVTIWCLMALLAGREAGFAPPESTTKLVETWFDQVTDPTGHCGYEKAGDLGMRLVGDHATRFPVEKGAAMTAAGLFGRHLLGQNEKQKPVMAAAVGLVASKPPVWDPKAGCIDEYYWWFATMALWHTGGKPWTEWRKRLGEALLKSQRVDSNCRGSWDPVGVWGELGGRVYSTAMHCLALQTEYRLGVRK